MINYLEKYNNLPKDLRDKISTPQVMDAIHDMEKRYTVNLAAIVMRVMVRDIKINKLLDYFVYTVSMSSENAQRLVAELKKSVFSEIANYLDYINEDLRADQTDQEIIAFSDDSDLEDREEDRKAKRSKGADFYFSIEDEDEVRNSAIDFGHLDKREQIAQQVEAKITNIIGQTNVIFSSEDMLNRLKQILKTYLRGVRDKIDTKLVLEREIANGGLALDAEIADDILKIVDIINKEEAQHPGRTVTVKKFHLPEDNLNNEGLSAQNKQAQQAFNGDVAYDFSKIDKAESLKTPAPDLPDYNKKAGLDIVVNDEEGMEEDSDEPEADDDYENEDAGESFDADSLRLTESDDTEDDEDPLKSESFDGAGVDDKAAETKEAISSSSADAEDKKIRDYVLDLSKKEEKVDASPQLVVSKKLPEQKKPAPVKAEADGFSAGMIAKARNKPLSDIAVRNIGAISHTDASGKVRMEDIKKVTKLGGPLEEIGSMSLVDFRRISKDPEEALVKIMKIFDLLEEDGYNKRLAGIKAWRQSPVNRLYLAIGQESIVKQKEVQKVIKDRQDNKKEYLSQDEFDAIMELNKKLRY